jgi:catechol 2,3-dioxygenase-like lactoylglutathione lyase family enzyme
MKTIDDADVPKACLDAAGEYGRYPDVVAVALGGSRSTGVANRESDFDLYVYTRSDLDLGARAEIARKSSTRAEVGNRFWEPGDEWQDQNGIHLDVMFRSMGWIEDQLARVLDRHEASVGYSTCFWANVLYSQPLFDRDGWFARLKERARTPYPEELRRAIIAKNWPILRTTLSSYRRQIERAVDRGDLVSVQHRVSAALASYFDILFALNRQPHPGEKRLIHWIEARCALRPERCREQVEALLSAAGLGGPMVVSAFDAIVDELESVLATEGFSVPGAHRPSPSPVSSPGTAVAHAALWTADIERSRAFYERYFGAKAGALYQSKRRAFASYFLQFPAGGRLELMQAPEEPERGWAHLALSLGSRQRVDEMTARLAADGVLVRSGPRQTGDGYYESVVGDPDGNELEITA